MHGLIIGQFPRRFRQIAIDQRGLRPDFEHLGDDSLEVLCRAELPVFCLRVGGDMQIGEQRQVERSIRLRSAGPEL